VPICLKDHGENGRAFNTSEPSDEAFAHALALALAYKHHFYLLHVKNPERDPEFSSFPLGSGNPCALGCNRCAAQSEVEATLGIKAAKVTNKEAAAKGFRHGLRCFKAPR